MYQIDITKPAEQNLNDAVTYIAKEVKNPNSTLSLLNLAEKTIGSLSNMPLRHALAEDVYSCTMGNLIHPCGKLSCFLYCKGIKEKSINHPFSLWTPRLAEYFENRHREISIK